MSTQPIQPRSQQPLIAAYDSPMMLPETAPQQIAPPVKASETREETTMASTAFAINEIATAAVQEVTEKSMEKASPTEKVQETVAAGEPLSEMQKKLSKEPSLTAETVVAGEPALSESPKKLLLSEASVEAAKPGASFKAIEGISKGLAMAAATNPIDVASNKFFMTQVKPKGVKDYIKLVSETPFKGLKQKMTGNGLSWGLMTILPGKIQARTDKFISNKKFSETASILLATVGENGLMMPLTIQLALYQATQYQKGQEKTFFQSVLDVNKAAFKEKGFLGALNTNYRGYLGTTLRSGLFFAPYVLSTEALKEQFKDSIEEGNKLSNKVIGAVFCSGVASVGATIVSCPANVLTMRMRASVMEQNRGKPRESYPQAIRNIYKESGWKGYTKGMGWGIIRIIPTGIVLGLITAGADSVQESLRKFNQSNIAIPPSEEIFPWGSD